MSLTDNQLEILNIVNNHGPMASAAVIEKKQGRPPTSPLAVQGMNTQLNRLMYEGLLDREKKNRLMLYTITNEGQQVLEGEENEN